MFRKLVAEQRSGLGGYMAGSNGAIPEFTQKYLLGTRYCLPCCHASGKLFDRVRAGALI